MRQESNANSTSKAVTLVRKATQNNDIPANRDANPRPYSSGGFVPNGGAPINPGAPLGRPSPTGEPSNGGGGGPSGGGGGGGPPNNGGGGPPNNGGGGPPYGGGGGGRPNPYSYGGGGDPGDNGPPNPGGNGGGPPAPYGMFPANIKTELKIEQLPEWDGNHWTAINYFWQVQQLAFLGGWLPEALGYWLWFRLKEGSGVRNWFVTLPMTHQAFMRSHYLKFLKGIKDGFLGNKWQLKMNNYYNNQTFRERNHEKELPADFITRRIVYTRMLLSVDVGGPLEVFYIMRKAPVSWGPILLLSSIKDSSELYSRVTEHEEALLEAYRVSKGGVPNSLDSIVTQLRQLGFVQERPPYRRQANVVENSNIPSFSTSEVIDPVNPNTDEHVLHEAYQVLQQRQRPPPKGGYPFSKNDHVTTKMGKLPPSPCKCCGSKNHWDKECPDWNMYLERTNRSVNIGESSPIEDEGERTYRTAYSILLNQRLGGEVVNQTHLEESLHQQDFKVASFLSQTREASKSRGRESRNSERISVEEIEDESWAEYLAKPKSTAHILEEVDTAEVTAHAVTTEERVQPNFRSPPAEDSETTQDSETKTSTESLPDAPAIEPRVKLKKRRYTPSGTSAVGVSVVATQGWVGSTRNSPVDLRMDSCADVTLISQEYYESLKDKPSTRKGIKMNLWQLMDKDSEIQGYVRIPIFMKSTEGTMIETEAEAYVVPNMTVPILLGEDYHLNYELIVAHKVDFCSTISFAGVPYSVNAKGVARTKDFDRLRQSAYAVGGFIKSKLHKRNKAKRARQRKRLGVEKRTIRAAEDYRLKPDECRRIRVDGHFEEDQEWLVEKNLLADSSDSAFVVPNVLISSTDPWIPISNPSPHPRTI